jgi:hypothetical protein
MGLTWTSLPNELLKLVCDRAEKMTKPKWNRPGEGPAQAELGKEKRKKTVRWRLTGASVSSHLGHVRKFQGFHPDAIGPSGPRPLSTSASRRCGWSSHGCVTAQAISSQHHAQPEKGVETRYPCNLPRDQERTRAAATVRSSSRNLR